MQCLQMKYMSVGLVGKQMNTKHIKGLERISKSNSLNYKYIDEAKAIENQI